MLLNGAPAGQLFNVSGSTDVLALSIERFKPHEQLLTRALGVGRKWLSVATIAAAGSSLSWAQRQLFGDMEHNQFWKLVSVRARHHRPSPVRFEPYLAGERTNIEQRQGAFTGLTLATTREQMLEAVIEAIARVSAERLPLLQSRGGRLRHKVFVSGGVQAGLDRVLHRDWPGKWTYKPIDEATLRGLGCLEPK
jgi:sugar (pentulose or hexulose) kinase